MTTVPCHLCWAEVHPDRGMKHREWHQAHTLHAASCDVTVHRIEQEGTGAYLLPRPCSCGLEATS